MRRFKIGDIVITDVSNIHKRIREKRPRDFVTLEWYDGTEPIPTELVHVSHLTFISNKPTEDFNYFYLLSKKK